MPSISTLIRAAALAWLPLVAVAQVGAPPNRPTPAATTPPAAPAPAAPATPGAPAATASGPAAQAAPVSASARRLFERSRSQLLQIRTLLNGSQASVGSGFVVSAQGLVITNYHVISQFALEPERYQLRFATTDGEAGELELLDFDARRDLALLRVSAKPELLQRMGAGALTFRPPSQPLAKGERIYSMGNPHDVAFAVVEGTYNGLVERSFDPLIYYSGAINPGMSGGPVLDEDGQVVGVNVSTMFLSQQMSFLVPGQHAQALLVRSAVQKALKGPAWPRLREQLMAYQDDLVGRFLSQPWRSLDHPRYRLPLPQEQYMRCWGSASPAEGTDLQMQHTQCRMEHAVFVNDRLQTGFFSVAQEAYDGGKLGALRFARLYSQSFRNESLGRADRDRTAPFCREEFVEHQGLPLRAVACLRAYRKLEGLVDLTVLVAPVDAATTGALGRFDARGVSFANATRLTRHYLQGFAWTTPR